MRSCKGFANRAQLGPISKKSWINMEFGSRIWGIVGSKLSLS